MDAKQLHECGRQLNKAHEAGESGTTILGIMAPLEKFTPSEDLLRTSRIGVVIAKLRQNKDPKVASLATQLVAKWKAAVKKKPGTSSPAPAKVANGVNGRSATNSPAPVKRETAKKFTVAPEKRTAKEDKVDTAVTDDQVRNGCVQLIYNGLCFMSEEAPDDILEVSKNVEAAGFKEYGPDTGATYRQKMRSLHLNLKMKQNTVLRKNVFSGAIPPAKFVTMTAEELKSEEKRKEDEALEAENMRQAQAPVEEKAISTTMTCGKCKQSKVAYSQAQTRSADEPMTTFCECMVCGNRWKFS